MFRMGSTGLDPSGGYGVGQIDLPESIRVQSLIVLDDNYPDRSDAQQTREVAQARRVAEGAAAVERAEQRRREEGIASQAGG